MTEPAQTTRIVLQRIADALDVPVQRFFDERMPSDADECLRLWLKIKTQEGRHRALEALREIGNEEPI